MDTIEDTGEPTLRREWLSRAEAAAALSVIAGLAHLWAAPAHSGGWWGYGAFFVGVGLAQTFSGFVLPLWPKPLLLVTVIWGNVGVILVYVVTRTSGIPLGPHAGIVEDATPFDVLTTVVELGLVFLLVTMLASAYRAWTINALLAVGISAWVLRLTGSLP
jgi:hypothetical protein